MFNMGISVQVFTTWSLGLPYIFSTQYIVTAYFEVLCTEQSTRVVREVETANALRLVLYCRLKTTSFECSIPQAQHVQDVL